MACVLVLALLAACAPAWAQEAAASAGGSLSDPGSWSPSSVTWPAAILSLGIAIGKWKPSISVTVEHRVQDDFVLAVRQCDDCEHVRAPKKKALQ